MRYQGPSQASGVSLSQRTVLTGIALHQDDWDDNGHPHTVVRTRIVSIWEKAHFHMSPCVFYQDAWL